MTKLLFPLFILVLLTTPTSVSADAPDLKMRFNLMDTLCMVPLDTFDRHIYLNDDGWGSFELDSVVIHFNNNLERPLEYEFSTFIGIDYDEYNRLDDTLAFDFTAQTEIDSISLFVEERDSILISGIRVIDYPDGLESKLTIFFNIDGAPSYPGFRFTYRADTISDWRQFQPLETGNIWRYGGPYTLTQGTRYQVIDEIISGDSTIYSISRQRNVYSGIDGLSTTLLPTDTIKVYTLGGYPYSIFSAGYYFLFSENFQPSNWEQYELSSSEGLLLNSDGTTDLFFSGTVGSATRRYGIGATHAFFDGGGGWSLQGYRIGETEWGDFSTIVGIDDSIIKLPSRYQLTSYPNPFNPSAEIRYEIPRPVNVSLIIYDVMGRKTRTLVSEPQSPGSYSVVWDGMNDDGSQVASGLYFARFVAGEFSAVLKMVYLR
ncbi:MAG: T9SS type A sorting domain-containing protein [Candidatus Marinimicrobia bacterium]|nr:T9SS type A sorting domain-containing protein [Candidatus Neomarinimicrobiota bacterium]